MDAYQALSEHFSKINHLDHVYHFSTWDEAVMMPVGGGAERARALATLQALRHEMLISKDVATWLEQAQQQTLSDPWQVANLNWIKKSYQNATCVPVTLVRKKVEAELACEQAWRTMRVQNDWRGFKPLLATSIALCKEVAAIKAEVFNKKPYDVLLDEFSPGVTQATIDPIFEQLKACLPGYIERALAKQAQQTLTPISGIFPSEKQKVLGENLMRIIGFDFDHGRLDVSHHPFCSGVPSDVRITTRYDEHDFISAAMAICHETGHAMYEFGLPEKWREQPVGKALGMTVHESQSLLIEMQACRSLGFMKVMAEQASLVFGHQEALNAENLFQHYTRVKPDFIRVDADELTYPLHVILRYEIEKSIFNENASVDDLPGLWNELMLKYLNIDTKENYRDGLMQDVHWPAGLFGYFPAYTLGALLAAQLFHHAKLARPQLSDDLAQGDFSHLFAWLRDKVHSQASALDFNTLLNYATGEMLNADYYLEHIKMRY